MARGLNTIIDGTHLSTTDGDAVFEGFRRCSAEVIAQTDRIAAPGAGVAASLGWRLRRRWNS